MKKIVSFIFVLCMVISMMAGCGGSESDGKTLIWSARGIGCAEDEIVHKEFNKMLNELMPGVQVKFIEENETNWAKWMGAGEVIDIAWTGYKSDVESEINQGSYLPLDEYISEEKTPNIYKEMQVYAEDYNSGTRDGKLYMIPNQQPTFTQSGALRIPNELKDYMDIDALLAAAHASPTTTRAVYEILTDYLEKVWAQDAYDTDTVSDTVDIITLFNTLATRGYDFIVNGKTVGARLCYAAFDEDPEIMSLIETDAYKLFLEYAAKWYKAGYIREDILINSSSGSRSPILTANASGMWYGTTKESYGEARGVTYNYDQGAVVSLDLLLDDLDNQYNGTSKLGYESTYLAVPFTSKFPEQAIALIDLLRSPVGTEGNTLANLLIYGFEKNSDYAKEYDTYHYTLNGDFAQGVDYSLQPTTNSKYGKPNWTVTNTFLTYRTTAVLEGQAEWALDFEANVRPTLHKTKYYRLRADLSEVLTDVANVAAVINEYSDQLVSGINAGNYQKLYDEMIEKANAANLKRVKEKISKQAQAYVSAS